MKKNNYKLGKIRVAIGKVYGEPEEVQKGLYEQERHAKNIWIVAFIVMAILWVWTAIYAVNTRQKLRVAQTQLELARQGFTGLLAKEQYEREQLQGFMDVKWNAPDADLLNGGAK